MVEWDKIEGEDVTTINKIVRRAGKEGLAQTDLLSLEMDLTACHISNPLRLEDLLKADKFNFAHDVCGIQRHINRDTGKLMNCFSPRYSKRGGK